MTVKIDGRKAEITNVGKRYDSYTGFAIKHGYPESAHNWETSSYDTRKRPNDGDIVTLLTSGEHESHKGDTLWIVESANGERHIIGEKGLRILKKVNEGITLLPDESLGGLMREYNEVKRNANVGELIKVIDGEDAGDGSHELGDIRYVIFADRWEDGRGISVSERAYATTSWSSGVGIYHNRYVVLEPSDIIRVDNARFRMVERKAAVGERVVVTNIRKKYREDETLAVGQIGVCTEIVLSGMNAIDTTLTHDNTGFLNPDRVSYRVLEPLESNAIPTQNTRNQAQLSSLDPVDQYASNIAALTTKVQALEKRVATLESASNAKLASGSVNDALPSFVPVYSRNTAALTAWADVTAPKKTDQQIRDEIVARAKADVKQLRNVFGDYVVADRGHGYNCNATFHVNSTKRKVTVILRGINSKSIRAVGRAICAPGEVFNVHIGKAIALHRALGLVVPAEYMSVPAPTEVRVGDVVSGSSIVEGAAYSVNKSYTITDVRGDGKYKYAETPSDWMYADDIGKIMDDSREESEGVNA